MEEGEGKGEGKGREQDVREGKGKGKEGAYKHTMLSQHDRHDGCS